MYFLGSFFVSGGFLWCGWRVVEEVENRKNWFLVESGGRHPFFLGKRLEISGFFNEKNT